MTQPKFERHYINNEKGLITTYYKAMEVDQWIEKHFKECAEQMENALKKLKKHSNAQSEAIMNLREAFFEKWVDKLADKNQQSVMAEDDDHRSSVRYGADYAFDLLLPALEALELIVMTTDGFESADVAKQALDQIKRKLEGE